MTPLEMRWRMVDGAATRPAAPEPMPLASRSATSRAAVEVGKRAEAEAAYFGLEAVSMTAPTAAPLSPTTAAVTTPSTAPRNPRPPVVLSVDVRRSPPECWFSSWIDPCLAEIIWG
jgi:hypothetical protein